jgi:hypothetical protein
MFIYGCSNYVYFILHVLSVVVSLIGGVPRMGPRVPFALLPFGHYPIKYLKLMVINKLQIYVRNKLTTIC